MKELIICPDCGEEDLVDLRDGSIGCLSCGWSNAFHEGDFRDKTSFHVSQREAS